MNKITKKDSYKVTVMIYYIKWRRKTDNMICVNLLIIASYYLSELSERIILM